MKGKGLRKTAGLALALTMLITSVSLLPMMGASAAGDFDYSLALKDSIIFYDANKCGKDVATNNTFSWRGACHTTDGSDVGVDLTGGYHDAGDHVKFGLPQGYAAAVLGWGLYEFKDGFDKSGTTTKMLQQLKYFTDYFLKSHPNANTFYYQLGAGDEDHTYWGAPETQPGSRPTKFVANAGSPASDVLGETSAALSLMYLNYKSVDSAYAAKCLQAAKELYTMGKTNLGYSQGESFYMPSSYYDDLSWAATWLYTIEKNNQYLEDAKLFATKPNKMGNDTFKNKWTMCWDDMYLPAMLRLADITGDQIYKDALNYNIDYWKTSLTTTPGGLKYLSNWGVLRYASAESMLALVYFKQTGDDSLKTFAKSQIDYVLGKNPASISYIIGFGSKYPLHPHHRAANGYTYANGDNQKAAKNLITGALVGGPDQTDKYIDDATQFQYTEVAIDYNAGLVGSLAGIMADVKINPVATPTPSNSQPTPTPTVVRPTPTPTVIEPTPSDNPGGYEFVVEPTFSSTRLVPNQMFTAKVTATNVSTTSYSGTKDVLLIVGLYDGNNTMQNVSYISKGIPYHGTESLSAGFKLPTNVTGYSVRAFMWDGSDLKETNMIPLSSVSQIP